MGTVNKQLNRHWPMALLLLVAGLMPLQVVLAQPASQATLQVSPAPAGASALLNEARLLIEQGRPAAARDLLAARELEFGGNPQFDYLLGVAALDSGRPDEAIFSLRRVLAAEPGFDGARMELARAYYESGDFVSAETQFSYLLTRSPPTDTRRVIERYLAAMDDRAAGPGRSWLAWIEGGGGYDSNANASTADDAFLGFPLNPENVETSSPFLNLSAGLRHTASYGGGLGSSAGLRGYYRMNPDARFVDQAIISGTASLFRQIDSWRVQGGVVAATGWRDGAHNENTASLVAGLSRQLAPRWELGAQLSGGIVRYNEDQLKILDVNRYAGSLTLAHLLSGQRPGRVALTVLGGFDEERRAGSPYGNSRIGVRLGTDLVLSRQAIGFLQLGYLNTDYDRSPGFFGEQRDDDQYTALLGAEIRNWPASGWDITPQLRYIRQKSTIALYDYDRVEAAVSVRRSFRGSGTAR